MKKILFFTFVISAQIIAAPLKNLPTQITQPNGEVINCFVSGDEFERYYHDKDGFVIIRNNSTGYWEYANIISNKILSSGYNVGKVNPKMHSITTLNEVFGVSNTPQNKRKEFNTMIYNYGKQINKSLSNGDITNLVFFVRFKNEPEFTDSFIKYNNLFNSEDPYTQSLKGYYKEVSYNQLNLSSYFVPSSQNKLVQSYQDAHERSYYSKYDPVLNPNGYTDENRYKRETTLLINAINYFQKSIPTDINFDANNDGIIDNIIFIISGNTGDWSDLLWPHMWSFEWASQKVKINNKDIGAFNFQLERRMDYYVLSHEMFHSLGAPDLYHYDQPGNPVESWDLMAGGHGYMGAYMKYKYGGWLSNIAEIKNSGTYSLQPLQYANNCAYKILSPNSDKEFFVIEYRKKEGLYEGNISQSGLLTYRINSEIAGNASGPPDEIYIYRPNGTSSNDGEIYNASFGKDYGRVKINDQTNPSCFLSNGNQGGLNIDNIGWLGLTVSFYVNISKSIMLTSFTNKDTITAGAVKKISWQTTGLEKIKIEYSTDNGTNWNLISANISSTQNFFSWQVPLISVPVCKVRISDTENSSIYSDSETFSIKMFSGNNITFQNSIFTEEVANKVIVRNNIAYIIAGNAGLSIVDINNMYEPKLISNLELDENCLDFDIINYYVFIVTDYGINVVDI